MAWQSASPPIMPCSSNLHRVFTCTVTCFQTFIAANKTGTNFSTSRNSSLKAVLQHSSIYEDHGQVIPASKQVNRESKHQISQYFKWLRIYHIIPAISNEFPNWEGKRVIYLRHKMEYKQLSNSSLYLNISHKGTRNFEPHILLRGQSECAQLRNTVYT